MPLNVIADAPTTANLPFNWTILLPVLTGFLAVYFGLPRPRGRHRFLAALCGSIALAGASAFIALRVGPSSAGVVETILFAAIAIGAVFYAGLMITQRNPARSAISFSLVVLHVCGLFLLNAAPFLMAATIIIYAGAIIVMFLFVLMLSNQEGYSDENDRSREPLMAALTGFALLSVFFVGLERVFDRAPVEKALADASALADAADPFDVWKTVDRKNPSRFTGRVDDALVRLGFPASSDPALPDKMDRLFAGGPGENSEGSALGRRGVTGDPVARPADGRKPSARPRGREEIGRRVADRPQISVRRQGQRLRPPRPGRRDYFTIFSRQVGGRFGATGA